MIPYESSKARSNVALVTLGIILASQVAGLVAGFIRLLLVQSMRSGRAAAQGVAQASDAFVGCAGYFQLVAIAVCAIGFSLWFHRVYRNLPALGATGLALSPGRAVGGFYIPIVNLFEPYGTMQEIWLHSQLPAADPLLEPAEPSRWIKIWWLSFIASNFLGNFSGVVLVRANGLGGLLWATLGMLASDALAILAAGSAMSLVRQVTAQQDTLHQHLEAQRASQAPVQEG
jgi:hypothetical protein